MAGYLPSSLANPSGRESVDWSLGPIFDHSMQGSSFAFSSSPKESDGTKQSIINPLDKEKVSRNFNFMIDTFFSINQDTTDAYIKRFQDGIDILSKQVSYLPMILVLHGTQDYDEPHDAYRMAEEATSRFTAAIRLITERLRNSHSEKNTGSAKLKPEEHIRLSQFPGCGEKDTLHGCLQALYNDFTERLNHFSHPTSPELPKPFSDALRKDQSLYPRKCPAWLTSTPPWILIPSAFHVLFLFSNGINDPSTRAIIDWIMCISIGASNVSRKRSVSIIHRRVLRKVVYLLEDTIKDTVDESIHKSYNFISTDIYIKFKELLEKDGSIRHDHLDYTVNGELPPTIDKMAYASYVYHILEWLRPPQFRSTPTRLPMSSRQQSKVAHRDHKALLGDLYWEEPKGKALKETMTTWIREYMHGYTTGKSPSPTNKNYRSCSDLLDELIPMAIQDITKDPVIQNKMEGEVREFLTKRTLNMYPRPARPLEKGKAELSKASNSLYRRFMLSSKFRIKHTSPFPCCIRDFLYAIHSSYLSNQELIALLE
ncbi:MAG: hypothetical protein DHS80DRAFT_26429 [Piptocephalis tieghemiana]|nr:MAG: hypothetical protein DHS80DRAFT_26429 [Piptocephalis tieghemiana]